MLQKSVCFSHDVCTHVGGPTILGTLDDAWRRVPSFRHNTGIGQTDRNPWQCPSICHTMLLCTYHETVSPSASFTLDSKCSFRDAKLFDTYKNCPSFFHPAFWYLIDHASTDWAPTSVSILPQNKIYWRQELYVIKYHILPSVTTRFSRKAQKWTEMEFCLFFSLT